MKRTIKNFTNTKPNVADTRENIYCCLALLQGVRVDHDKTTSSTEIKYQRLFSDNDEVNIKFKILELVADL